MKLRNILLACVVISPHVLAQSEEFSEEIIIPLSNPGQMGTLEVHQIEGGIKVIGYDGKEVVLVAKQKRVKQATKMKNGLRKIENNSLAVEAEESGNHVEVHAMNHASSNPGAMNLEIKVPKNFNLQLNNINNGSTWVEGVDGEFEISNINNDITLNNVSGSAVVDTVNGDIKAQFNATSKEKKMMMTTFNGDVDLTLPKNTAADLKMKTFSGEIFTDFDMQLKKSTPEVNRESKKKTYHVKIENWVMGAINGGGPEMVLTSHSGDIIVRSE